jgi:hypothetical protein
MNSLNKLFGEGFEEDNPELVKEYKEAIELHVIAESIDCLQEEIEGREEKNNTHPKID